MLVVLCLIVCYFWESFDFNLELVEGVEKVFFGYCSPAMLFAFQVSLNFDRPYCSASPKAQAKAAIPSANYPH
jgi:hypothetical protein